MAKLMKILAYVLSVFLDWFLILLFVVVFIVRFPQVQTYIAQKATAFLSEKLKTNVHIDNVAIVFLDRVALNGFYIEDENGDVLGRIGTLIINFKAIDFAAGKITLEDGVLDGGYVHLQRDKSSGKYNYQFIADQFTTDEKQKESKPFLLTLRKLILDDLEVRYDDHRKSYLDFGMDWDHLHFKHTHLTVHDLEIKGNRFKGEIVEFSTSEKSGFRLKQLQTYFWVNDTGIHCKDLAITTEKTLLSAPQFKLRMSGLSDLNDFVDSVSFDCYLAPSSVSLKDVSYFATALEGMDQQVDVEAVVRDKVNGLKIQNFTLKTGQRTRLSGSVTLPNFEELEKAHFNERLTYAYIDLGDLQKIKLPKDAGKNPFFFGEMVDRFEFAELKGVRLAGSTQQFEVRGEHIRSAVCDINWKQGLLFSKEDNADKYLFRPIQDSVTLFDIQQFELDQLLRSKTFGKIKGKLMAQGSVGGKSGFEMQEFSGTLQQFYLANHTYENLEIKTGSLQNEKVSAEVLVKDPNLKMEFTASVKYNEEERIVVLADIQKADLKKLSLTQKENSLLEGRFAADVQGFDLNEIKGTLDVQNAYYREKNKIYPVPNTSLTANRGEFVDRLELTSSLVDLSFTGKVNFNEIGTIFQNQLATVLPALIEKKEVRKKAGRNNHFTYSILMKNEDELLHVFVPELNIAEGTKLSGDYDQSSEDFQLVLQSPRITYQDFSGRGILVSQTLRGKNLQLQAQVDRFNLNDSVSVKNLSMNTTGTADVFQTTSSWNPDQSDYSKVEWETKILGTDHFDFNLRPSFITLKGKRWAVKNDSEIDWDKNSLVVDNFKFERDDQFISINGKLSRNDEDKLNIKISHLDLNDFGDYFPTPVKLEGEVNGFAFISNPFENMNYNGDASIRGLRIDGEEVGNIFVQSQWSKGSDEIKLSGDIIYRNTPTFSFEGAYNVASEKNPLDFNLVFDNTDIAFTNVFLDPKVVRNIQGTLNGKVSVKGSPDKPELAGKIKLSKANAFIGLLGVNIKTNGNINISGNSIEMNVLPIIDEEGNKGSVTGQIYHENFTGWNFDLFFDVEDDRFARDDMGRPLVNKKLERFLILNTEYKEGDVYYGRGYVTGTASISGYAENLTINANVKTERGTQIFFPMYGVSEISEEQNFIRFVGEDQTLTEIKDRIDFTGVDLNLNFKVTPDAKLKIIFDERVGDEISAEGNGNISLKVNNIGDISLEGSYTVKEGVYNFAMGPVKQNFYIEEGGSITWTGDPYNANLNLRCYYKVQANLAEISPDQLSNTNTSNQEILCYLTITETLIKPAITFEITSPKASESGKALLGRINSDNDELNRQFFSLLLTKSFQPLSGSRAGGGGALADAVSQQINSMLSQLSETYQLAVNLDANALTGNRSYEFDISRQFLDNRLVVTGSFGVENASNLSTNQTQSYLIGDVNLEYLLNESGSFRVNVFNESNQNRVLQNNQTGLFKQGVGLNYHEDFNSMRTFKVWQYFLDIFRKPENKKFPIKRKNKQTPVPPVGQEPKIPGEKEGESEKPE